MSVPDSRRRAERPSPFAACTAFEQHRLLAAGPLADVARAVARRVRAGRAGPFRVFDDMTGERIDLDLRGTDQQILAAVEKLRATPQERRPSGSRQGGDPQDPQVPGRTGAPALGAARRRGRPRLGVVAREVTLLPRHWQWLEAQPGGISAALRRLVDEAGGHQPEVEPNRAAGAPGVTARKASHDPTEAAARFLTAIGRDLPDHELALRALAVQDRERFAEAIARWPAGIRAYASALGFPDHP